LVRAGLAPAQRGDRKGSPLLFEKIHSALDVGASYGKSVTILVKHPKVTKNRPRGD